MDISKGFLLKCFLSLFGVLMHFAVNLKDSILSFYGHPSLTHFFEIIKTFGVLILNSQDLLYKASIRLAAGGLETWTIVGLSWEIIGSSIITLFMIYLPYKILLWITNDEWDKVTRLVAIVVIIAGVGFLGSYFSYAETGILQAPFHGFISLIKLF